VEQKRFRGYPDGSALPPSSVEFGAQLLADDPSAFARFGPQESTLADTVRILRKRKWIILTSAAVMVILATIVSLRMTKKYDASARIDYSKESNESLGFKDVPGADDNGGEGSDYSVAMDTQIKILESDRIALGVINNLHLDQNPVFAGKLATTSSKIATINVDQIDHNREAALLDRFHGATTVRSVRNTRLIQITFRSPDPVLAAAVVNNMVNTYVEDNYRTRYESTMQASDWLAKQISDLQLRVETSQEKLVRYQRENGIVGIDEKQNIVTQKLDDLSKNLTEAEADRMSKQAAYESARAGKLEQLGESSGTDLTSHLLEQEATLRSQYAQLTTTFGPNYPKALEVKNQIDQTQRSLEAEAQRVVKRLQSNLVSAQAREVMLRSALEDQKVEANQLNEKAIDFSILKRDLDANHTLYEGLLQKLKEAGVAAGLRSSNIRVVDVARVPVKPAVPNLPRNLALSLAIGLVGGVVLSFVIETLDNTVQTPDQVQALTGSPSLGLVPESKLLEGVRNIPRLTRSPEATREPSTQLVTQLRPNSDIAESYRTVRTSILLSSAVRPPRVMMFTSPLPQEGKTTTSVNMAVVLAQRGVRVLLIDADMRRPSVHAAFGLPNSSGLSSLLAGLDEYEKVVHGFAPQPSLFIMTSGPIAPNPAELLGSDRMRDLLAKLRTEYDHVILDTPPVIPVTDPAVLSAMVDAVLLVVRSGKTTKNALRHARNLLLQINAPVMGTIVNGANMRSPDYYYQYYYGYRGKGYYHSDGEGVQAKKIAG
jgi:capsular exopolysaccharide synthesis family protein